MKHNEESLLTNDAHDLIVHIENLTKDLADEVADFSANYSQLVLSDSPLPAKAAAQVTSIGRGCYWLTSAVDDLTRKLASGRIAQAPPRRETLTSRIM